MGGGDKQDIVSESESPGRHPGGEVKAQKRNWGRRPSWKSEEGVEDRALRKSSVQPGWGQAEKPSASPHCPADILVSASRSTIALSHRSARVLPCL